MSFNFSTMNKENDKSTQSTYRRDIDIRHALYSHGNEKQEEIYPPTVSEISSAQREDRVLRTYFKHGGKNVPRSTKLH